MKYYFKYFAALLLFGSNGIVASKILLKSYEIVFLRTMIGTALLICLFLLTKQKITFYKNKKDFLFIVISGFAMGMSWILLYEAYTQIGVSISSLLYYCGPIIVMLVSSILFGEKITNVKKIGFIIVLVGVLFINFSNENHINFYGLICGSISAIMYSIMVILNKYSKNIVGIENAMIQLAASFVIVSVFTIVKSGFPTHINTNEWIWIAFLGLFNTGIGCYFYFSSIAHLPVQTVAVCGYLEPLSAVVLSVLLLSEMILPIQVLGIVIMIGGALICELYHREKVF